MSSQPADRDLRELFQELREEDRAQAPDFQEMMARVREERSLSHPSSDILEMPSRTEPHGRLAAKPRMMRRLAWGGSVLAAACAATVLLIQFPNNPDAEFERVVQSFSSDPASGAWRSPTDALLDLPGGEILSTIPSIGSRRWSQPAGDDPRRNEL